MTSLSTPRWFSFMRAVQGHGWFELPPFHWDEERSVLHRVLSTARGKALLVSISSPGPGRILVNVRLPRVAKRGRGSADRAEAARQVRHMLRLDEPFEDFHRICRRIEGFAWAAESGAGPLLRAPDPFEDLVKMICTTNCTWALTRVMVKALVAGLGRPLAASPGLPEGAASWRAFPTPEAMAQAPLSFYVRRARAGYRAAALKTLAERVAAGDLDPRRWLERDRGTEAIRAEIESVRGAGPYVADNMLKLLGRYEGLGIDSWCRRKFAAIYHGGRRVGDRRIARFYAPFGAWRGLALWCNLTRDWFEGEGPVALLAREQKY